MPIKVPNDLPVRSILEQENIFVMDENRAIHQDIRPIQILILNLMPLKEDTELQILRELSNTPLQIDCTFMRTMSHEGTHTSTASVRGGRLLGGDGKDLFLDQHARDLDDFSVLGCTGGDVLLLRTREETSR